MMLILFISHVMLVLVGVFLLYAILFSHYNTRSYSSDLKLFGIKCSCIMEIVLWQPFGFATSQLDFNNHFDHILFLVRKVWSGLQQRNSSPPPMKTS